MKEIIVPQFGETIDEEITISEWLKEEGEDVRVGEVLVLVETGKAQMEIESIYEGKLSKKLAVKDDQVTPLQVIGYIE